MRRYKELTIVSLMAVAIIIASCKMHFETKRAQFKATASTQAFERGKYLALNICADCHYNKQANKFIGMQMHEEPKLLGVVYSANLTNSKTHGIPPRYTDAELKYLFKTGIAKDGRFLAYMFRPNMADDDINAIIVFLRSDDHLVAAADTTIGLTHLNILGKIGNTFTGKPAPYATGIKVPAASDAVATGRYMVDVIGCYHCHSKSFTSLNYIHPEESKDYMEGGIKFKSPTGEELIASNLTPDKETGIGNYSREDFRKAVKDGMAPRGLLHLPMPRFHALKDKEADDIYAYLQTIPAKYNKIKGH